MKQLITNSKNGNTLICYNCSHLQPQTLDSCLNSCIISILWTSSGCCEMRTAWCQVDILRNLNVYLGVGRFSTHERHSDCSWVHVAIHRYMSSLRLLLGKTTQMARCARNDMLPSEKWQNIAHWILTTGMSGYTSTYCWVVCWTVEMFVTYMCVYVCVCVCVWLNCCWSDSSESLDSRSSRV